MDAAVLQDVAEDIRVSTGAILVMVFIRPYQKERLQTLVISGHLTTESAEQVEGHHRKLASSALKQATPLYVSDGIDLPLTPAARSGHRTRERASSAQIRSVAAIPLRVDLRVDRGPVGALLISYGEPQRFKKQQRTLVESLARQAGMWLQQAGADEELSQRHSQDLTDLQDVDREITHSLDLDKVLHTILNSASRHVGAADGMIALLNPWTGMLEARAVIGRDTEARAQWTAKPDRRLGLTQRAFVTKRPVRVDDLRTSRQWKGIHSSRASSTVSELAVPLINNDEPFGVINFESAEIGAFGNADEDFLVTLAGQTVLAIKNAEDYEHARRVADERQILMEVSKEITRQFEPAETFALILREAIQITGATAATLHLVNRRHNDLEVAAEEGGRDPSQRQRQGLGEGIVGRVAESERPVNVGDVTQPPWDNIYIPFIPGILSELAVPLYAAGRVRGVINVESRERNKFKDRDEHMLTALADLAVIAIENAERFKQAQDREHRIETLHTIDQEIIGQLDDPHGVIHTLLLHALSLLGADAGSLHLFEGKELTRSYSLRTGEQSDYSLERIDTPRHGPIGGLADHVVRTRAGYATRGDAQADSKYVNGRLEVHSAAGVPLLAAGGLIGVLEVESAGWDIFDEDILSVLDLLAGQAVIAIQKADAYARVVKESQRFERLYRTAQQLGGVIDLDHIEQAYDIVFNAAYQPVTSRQVVLRRYDPDRRELVVVRSVVGHPIPARDIRLDDGANGWVARTHRTAVIPDTEEAALHQGDMPNIPVHQERSLVVVALLCDSSFYGTLTLSHEQRNHFARFEEADLQLYEELAHQLALTIHRHEVVRARGEAERRAIDAETVGEVGQLTLDLAHRLKGNLGLVDTYVQNVRSALAGSTVDTVRANEALDKIARDVSTSLGFGNRLVESILSAFGEQSEALTKRRILVAELFERARLSYPEKPQQITVDADIAPEVDTVYAYPHHLDVILYNVFVNGIEAMPPEGGKIIFRAVDAGSSVLLQVEDTGPGIPAARRAAIFNPFVSSKGKGSWGVGLWTALLHARRTGGELTVESTEGKGTTFTLRLPKEG